MAGIDRAATPEDEGRAAPDADRSRPQYAAQRGPTAETFREGRERSSLACRPSGVFTGKNEITRGSRSRLQWIGLTKISGDSGCEMLSNPQNKRSAKGRKPYPFR